ncbi:MAG: hypothetical protein V5A62_02855 [Haloarculaceae archaeon]
MAARRRAAPRNDVRAVLASFADGPQELLATGYRLAQRRAEPGRRLTVEATRLAPEVEEEAVPVRLDPR